MANLLFVALMMQPIGTNYAHLRTLIYVNNEVSGNYN